MKRRISVIHAYVKSMAPIQSAFEALWPDAQLLHLLDESLYADVDSEGTMTEVLLSRVASLFAYAESYNADGIIFTGSTFTPAVARAKRHVRVPVLDAVEAMAEAAVRVGRRITVLGTAKRAIPVVVRSVQEAAERGGIEVEVVGRLIEGAQDRLRCGATDDHDRLIANAVEAVPSAPVICLAQMSMATALRFLPTRSNRTVLTSPRCAVMKMKQLLCGE